LYNKYLHSKTLSQVSVKPMDSPFWKGLMKVKEEFFSRGSFKLGDGMNTRFWEDTWLGDKPLADQYPSLYSIVHRKQVSVANVLNQAPLNISFRRTLSDGRWRLWLHLVERLMHINLTSETDTFVWGLTKSGRYTVKSMYLDIINDDTKFLRRYIWKMKVPLKIKIFMWFVHRKEILTKDNLKKRNWDGDTKCCFCDDEESVNHIFIECPFAKIVWRIIHMSFGLAPPKNIKNLFGNWLTGIPKQDLVNIRVGVCAVLWALWNTRNDVVFNKPKKHTCMQVIPMTTHWIRLWSYLQPEEKRGDMDSGCNRMETVTRDLFNRCGWRQRFRIST
jgi:hypothetical protein